MCTQILLWFSFCLVRNCHCSLLVCGKVSTYGQKDMEMVFSEQPGRPLQALSWWLSFGYSLVPLTLAKFTMVWWSFYILKWSYLHCRKGSLNKRTVMYILCKVWLSKCVLKVSEPRHQVSSGLSPWWPQQPVVMTGDKGIMWLLKLRVLTAIVAYIPKSLK